METKAKEIIETAIEEKSEIVPEVMESEVTALQDALNELDVNDRKSIIYLLKKTHLLTVKQLRLSLLNIRIIRTYFS